MLGITHQLDIGLFIQPIGLATALGEALEGATAPVLTQIAGHSLLQILNRDGTAPASEGVADGFLGALLMAHEEIGLQHLNGQRIPAERKQHIAGEIEHKAPEHTLHERRDGESKSRPSLNQCSKGN